MSRRPTLPGADELFRATSGELADAAATPAPAPALAVAPALAAVPAPLPGDAAAARLRPTRPSSAAARRGCAAAADRGGGPSTARAGRERHEEKITVYLSPEELMELERARMDLFGGQRLEGRPRPDRARGGRDRARRPRGQGRQQHPGEAPARRLSRTGAHVGRA